MRLCGNAVLGTVYFCLSIIWSILTPCITRLHFFYWSSRYANMESTTINNNKKKVGGVCVYRGVRTWFVAQLLLFQTTILRPEGLPERRKGRAGDPGHGGHMYVNWFVWTDICILKWKESHSGQNPMFTKTDDYLGKSNVCLHAPHDLDWAPMTFFSQ